ncbi:MAG: nuclease A inhibitor family protein [Minicystis sp.]
MKPCLPLAALALFTAACAGPEAPAAEAVSAATSALVHGARAGESSEPDASLCGADFAAAIDDVTAGLTWPSESDDPIEPVLEPGQGAKAPTAPQVRALFHVAADAPIEERSTYAFDDISRSDPDPAADEQAAAARYRALRHVLEHNLTDLRFFYFGETEVGVYIVGRTRCGELAGIHATSIET